MPTINGVADLRSDTLSLPTQEMYQAMVSAPLGDDVWGTDPTVAKLEKLVAEKANKPAALFFPSGVMANLAAAISHCQMGTKHGPPEIVIGHLSHMAAYEAGGTASLGGIFPRQLPNLKDGTMDLALIEDTISNSHTDDVHFPTTKLVCLEQTHNKCGGRILSLEYCAAVRKIVDKFTSVKLHCDGARMWHACIALDKSLAELAAPFDSVSLCLSKGLGAPVGSVLVGDKDFITLARRYRKTLGGGMRQSGVLAAAGIYSIENNFARLKQDHDTASRIASVLAAEGFDVLPVDTNIVIWRHPHAAKFCEFCEKNFKLLLSNMGSDLVRAVPHLGTDHTNDVALILKASIAARKHFASQSKI